MANVQRLDPMDYFTQEQWAALTHRSSWRGLCLVAHAWLSIGACMALAVAWPWLTPLLIPVVACRQLGLLILMHDGAHALLHPKRSVNDWVSYWLCSSALHEYRPYHLQHHRFAMQKEDPDLGLAKSFPTTRQSLWRKVLRDVTGVSFLKLQFGINFESNPKPVPSQQLLGHAAREVRTESAVSKMFSFIRNHRRYLGINLLGFATFSWGGVAWVWFTLWLVPMVFWFPMIYRLRNIAEHAMLQMDESSVMRQARTTKSNWLERVLVAPYWVNYHCEHHMFTQLPCWSLPKAHSILEQKGVIEKMAVMPGYVDVMRLVTRGGSIRNFVGRPIMKEQTNGYVHAQSQQEDPKQYCQASDGPRAAARSTF